MHAIITTPGFIIDSRTYSEADKMYSIFTRECGLVKVVATGIRLEKSKLRYHMRDHSLGSFSLVRGRDIWRLTNAEEIHVYGDPSHSSHAELLARISLLLRRVLHGEDPNEQLYDHLFSCAQFLAHGAREVGKTVISNTPQVSLTDSQLQTLESLTVLRILHSLGYVGNDADIQDCLKSAEISVGFIESVDKTSGKRALLNKHINKAFQESHL